MRKLEELNKISYEIIGSVYDVHNKLGPGRIIRIYL